MKRENYIMKLSTIELLPLGIFVVIRTKSPVGNIWDFCPRLLIESQYNFQYGHFATNRKQLFNLASQVMLKQVSETRRANIEK